MFMQSISYENFTMMNKLMKAYTALEKSNISLIIKTQEDLDMINNIIPLVERYIGKDFLGINLSTITAARRRGNT